MKWWHLETLGETHGLGGFLLLELNGPIFLGGDTLVDLLLMFACLRKKLVLWIWMAYQFLNYLGLCNQKSGGCPDLRSNLSIRGRDWIMEVNSMSGVLRPQNEFEVACNVDPLGSLVETRSLCPPTPHWRLCTGREGPLNYRPGNTLREQGRGPTLQAPICWKVGAGPSPFLYSLAPDRGSQQPWAPVEGLKKSMWCVIPQKADI